MPMNRSDRVMNHSPPRFQRSLGARRPFRSLLRGWALVLLGLVALGAGCSKQARAHKHLGQADRYFQAEDYGRAEIEYLNALRLEPTNRQALVNLGLVYCRQGVLPKAAHLLHKAQSQDTNDVEAQLYLGQTLEGLGDAASARREALAILTRQPTHEQALLLFVDTCVQTNDLAQARARLEGLRGSMGQRPGYLVALGTVLWRQGDWPSAAAAFRQALAADPKSAPAHASLASFCILSNDLKEAASHLKAAAEGAPLHSVYRLKYAEFLTQTGQLVESRHLLEDLTKRAPDFLPAWLRLSELALASNRPQEAEASLKRILSQDPVNYHALVLGARLRLTRQETAGAVQDLEKLRALYPKVPEACFHLALAHLANNEPPKAAAALGQALAMAPNYAEAELLLAEVNLLSGRTEAALSSLAGLVQRQPQMYKAWLDLGRACQANRNLEGALDTYQRMTALFPKAPQAYWLAGTVLRAQQKPAPARAAFEKALELAPNQPAFLEALIGLDIQEQRFPAALQRLQAPLQQQPKSAALRVLLASVHLAAGNTPLAEAALLQAIELDPASSAPYLTLARLYAGADRKAEALAKLSALTAKRPEDASAHMLMALIHQAGADYAAARLAYEKVLQINPKSVQALNNLAYLLSEHLNQLDAAFECATKARQAAPADPDTADTLGWVLFKRKDYASALNLLLESAASRPSNSEIQFHLGLAHYMMAAEESARVALQQALSQTNSFPGGAEAEQRLAFLKLDFMAAGGLAALEKRLQEQPDDPVALSRLGTWHERSNAPTNAAFAYERALRASPKALPILLKLARLEADHLHRPAKALELARRSRQLAPADPAVAWLLGRLACATGDPSWGLGLLQESAQKLPAEAELQYDLGLALYSNGRMAEAETALQHALAGKAFSRAEAARRFLALSRLHTDPARAEQARAQIQEALQADPDCLPALMATGVLQEQAQDLEGARKTYERILALSPDFSPALRQLALLCAQKPEESKRALELGWRARRAYPQDALLAKALGLLCYREKDARLAIELLQDCIRLRPSDGEAFVYLGLAQASQKNKKESAEALNQALRLDLAPALAQEARRALERIQ
jgi:tetratricopeptide (TPR) repeat protein